MIASVINRSISSRSGTTAKAAPVLYVRKEKMEPLLKRVEQTPIAKYYALLSLVCIPLLYFVWLPDFGTGERNIKESALGSIVVALGAYWFLRIKGREERIILIGIEGIAEGNTFRSWSNLSSIYPVTVSPFKKTCFVGGTIRGTGIVGFVVKMRRPLTEEEYRNLAEQIHERILPVHPHLKIKANKSNQTA